MESDASAVTLGLFEKRIDGDDALMELAQLRFQQAGMNAEMHAGTPEELEQVMLFRPPTAIAVVVHLPRNFSLVEEWCRKRILELAFGFKGRISGLLLHDSADLEARAKDFCLAAKELNSGLEQVERGPTVYIEYAAGLPPAAFARFFELVQELPRVSACVDIGHVGIRQARKAYAAVHPGKEICDLKATPAELPETMADLQNAVASALPVVLELIARLGAVGKPVHFHLHDGHPLSTLSPFGVSDHLSFLEEIPLAFEYQGRHCAPLMFGPLGLARIVESALEAVGRERVSFTLEVHPARGRLALGDAASLFSHWRDKTNAERMNQWLLVLAQNHELLQNAIKSGLGRT
jgi:hypothetical protein